MALPLNERYWYFYKTGERAGRPLARCIICNQFAKTGRINNNAGRPVSAEKVRDLARELVNRMGFEEAKRFSGLTDHTLRHMVRGTEGRKFQKKSVAKLVLAVDGARKQGIMRHKKSIAHGAELRQAARVREHRRVAALNGTRKVVRIPEAIRSAPKVRKVRIPSDQYGPIYPELEARMLAEEAARKKRARRIQLTRQQVLALFHIAHTNLIDSQFDLTRPDSGGKVLCTVTSPTVPGSETVYELPPKGGATTVAVRNFIPGILEQDVGDDD